MAYDTGYDDGSRSLTAVSCSDGQNGLITRYGWQTQGQIPKFPYIGAAAAVEGWNSANVSFLTPPQINDMTDNEQCGTCWRLTYPGSGKSITVLAVDHAGAGFNIALDALNDLTNGQGTQLGRVEADAVQVGVGECGI